MTHRFRSPLPVLVAVTVLALNGCSRADAGQGRIAGTSRTLQVAGRYETVSLGRIESLTIEAGKLVLADGATRVTLDMPASANPDEPSRDWALITESDVNGARDLTFIHGERLDEFTVTLPKSDAPIRYQVFAGQKGEDVLILAWGANGQSRWGYATLTNADPAR